VLVRRREMAEVGPTHRAFLSFEEPQGDSAAWSWPESTSHDSLTRLVTTPRRERCAQPCGTFYPKAMQGSGAEETPPIATRRKAFRSPFVTHPQGKLR
jgi:hypothetical protein